MSATPNNPPPGDLKARSMANGVTGSKPRLSILPYTGQVYGTRPLEYGSAKYSRGNYHAPPPPELDTDPEIAAVKRLLCYLDAAGRHIGIVTDAINRALGTGGNFAEACSIVDSEASGGFPPSLLPHLSHAIASLMVGVTCAADDGLMPHDPGQPWRETLGFRENAIEARKSNPAKERARVAALRKARKIRRAR